MKCDFLGCDWNVNGKCRSINKIDYKNNKTIINYRIKDEKEKPNCFKNIR